MSDKPKINRDEITYRPGQAAQYVIPHLPVPPTWLIDCGPGSAEEYIDFRAKWPAIKLLGLEPSEIGFRKARERFPADATLLQTAVWDVDEAIMIHKANDILHGTAFTDFDHIVRNEPGGLSGDMIEVQACSLDSLDVGYGPFENAFLWLDIEGSELRALAGAAGLLARGAICGINIETRPQFEREIRRLLIGHGFRRVNRYLECASYWDDVWVRRK